MTHNTVVPTLAVVIVGNRPDSVVYVSHKEKACAEVGMRSIIHRLPEDTTEEKLLSLIDDMNRDTSIHGVLIQLPFADGCRANADTVLARLDPNKDADGLHFVNSGRLMVSGTQVHIIIMTLQRLS
jgi:methylenetetrahydrofolate dehydrogenase (NADP+)/methenyltetrahydrofolate cyclohydrolase